MLTVVGEISGRLNKLDGTAGGFNESHEIPFIVTRFHEDFSPFDGCFYVFNQIGDVWHLSNKRMKIDSRAQNR
jgi:hypothetical protein